MTVITRLVYTDLVNNNNKYYQVEDEGGQIRVRWGRVGNAGQAKTVSKYEAEELVYQKKSKGYREVELHIPVVTKATNANTPEEKFIEYVYRASGNNISSFMSNPVDALSSAQIDKGRYYLEQMKKYGKTIAWLSDYYKVIPTNIGNQKRLKDHWEEQQRLQRMVDNFNFSDEEERLDQLEAAIATYNIQQSGSLTIPGLTVKHAEGATREAIEKILYGQQKASPGSRRMFGKPRAIYETRIAGEREAWEKNPVGNTQYMFHGSKAVNLLHILNSGLRKPAYAANGWRLGPGIYFAHDPLRAYQYARSYDGLDFLLLCGVRLGKSFDEPSDKSYNTPPMGYNSVRGTQSWSGIDEWTIYDASQQTLRAVIEFRG